MQTVSRQIAKDLQALGVRTGGILLVHASYKSLGPVPGGPAAVIEGLKLALGADGTLLFPALSYETVDQDQPVFDVRHTPSCVGALPEFFRTMSGTQRSLHPTHSVSAQGSQAASLVTGHELDCTPCGEHSPFRRLQDLGGQILMLGCGLLPNTSMHAIEELAEAPYLFEEEPVEYILIGYDGEPFPVVHRRHNHFPQHYDRVRAPMLGRGLREGTVLQARCHLIEAFALRETALALFKQDPYYFHKD